ncbi:MAG: aldehyde dehydrogenase family protein [Saprospiraceae bacterium]|nr:aldehyde dehydrogenase family protein [Saprospiraceae bacterium]
MSEKILRTISPVDGSIYVERRLASEKQIEAVLDKSERAQFSWKRTSIQQRATICEKVVEYYVTNATVIGEEISWQMGRPIRYTPSEITKGFQERALHMIRIAEEALADQAVDKLPGFQRFIRRDPLGVVMVLAPWNYPYLTAVNSIIPAIMSGNSVILKHAQQTPLCAERFAEAFKLADLPEGVFQFLHVNHSQVADIIRDSRISYVAFTGSVDGGQAIKNAIGQRFINAGLELGGKDPAYVTETAHLQNTVENLVDGSFFNSGQSCCGIERIYVHQSLYDSFVSDFVELTNKYKLGNPLSTETTLGPMVKTSAAKNAQSQIAQAIKNGATALINPDSFSNHQEGTPYMAPQVLINVNHTMQIMREETFGPVVGIMPVKSDEEAIQLMNDSRYGLTASIWTDDVDRAIAIGDQLETGTCFMNRCDYLDPALAWTGVKDSGTGVTLSQLGYEMLTKPKSFHLRSV